MDENIRKVAKISGNGLKSLLEAYLFLLDISCAPISRKIMLAQFGEIFNPQSINVNLHRLLKKGLISQLEDKNNLLIKVLESRKSKLLGNYAAIKMDKFKKKWDGVWRLIIYDIPETKKSEREYLRNTLKLLGFGKIQDSCLASPYDYSYFVYDICKKRGIADCVCLYEGKFFAGKNTDILIKEAWGLEEIKKNYHNIIASISGLLSRINHKNVALKDFYEEYLDIYDLFKKTVIQDPFLPEQFLIDWPFGEAESKFKILASSVFKNTCKKY
ncbi:MAG: PaaX family transcriptional regulator C-terminal domain-containing protein [Candidatus Omnitrophota bacterium]|jgi:phenylacetic acid degradation operon negative regulatory protein